MKCCSVILLVLIPCTRTEEVVHECFTPNDEVGLCVRIYDCPILYNSIRSADPKKIQFLKRSQCSLKGAPFYPPYVCCGSTDSFLPPASIPSRTLVETGLPDRSSCGFQDGERIAGGKWTSLSEYPWMALLQYRKNLQTAFACGGSLISKRYVLTAAHCVSGFGEKDVGKLDKIRLGEWNTKTEKDCVSKRGFTDCNELPVDVPAQEVIIHPEYKDSKRVHDIALIRLSFAINFTDFIKPICLPSLRDQAKAGEKLVVAGWGLTESLTSSSTKLKLQVPVWSADDCAEKFRKRNLTLTATQMCAGEGKGTCQGDSGGPLMNTFSNDSGQWYVEGIVSLGVPCGREGYPSVYTRVSSYLEWIRKNVRP